MIHHRMRWYNRQTTPVPVADWKYMSPDRRQYARLLNEYITEKILPAVVSAEYRIAVGRLLARFPVLEPAGEPRRDRRVRFRGFFALPARLSAG